ncbi:hypothetical protein [Salinicola sp. RZ23]|uniref:hypothetical protein n=1 Tax=Salinicola sp. RZ23 TaxID=1949087 RepID=UPI000DA21A7B|nr:hypothetical protein [Salinicola sp. RZ23]
MAEVTFPNDLGGDGLVVTDDANPDTGLAAGGHRLRFVPALSNSVAMARTATDKAALAQQLADQTAADRVQTGQDRDAIAGAKEATAADRVQTGKDATAASASKTAAANSQAAAKASETAAANSASAAASSESGAATARQSATNAASAAAGSASAAKDSETAAANSASSASSSKTAAANSASSASSSKTAAANSAAAAANSAASVDAGQIMHKRGSGLPNTVGTAATRDVGLGSGELMEVGAFGIGPAQNLPDEFGGDVNTPVNKFHIFYSNQGLQNGPPGNGTIINIPNTLGRVRQVYYRTNDISSPDSYSTYERYYLPAEGWTRFAKQFTTANCVGAVYDTNGMASGAIIESGTGPTGHYIKWADGTLMCWGTVTLTYDDENGDSSTLAKVWIFPVNFPTAPLGLQGSHAYHTQSNVSVDVRNIGPVGFFLYNSSTSVGVRVYKPTTVSQSFAKGDTFTVRVFATGRWR